VTAEIISQPRQPATKRGGAAISLIHKTLTGQRIIVVIDPDNLTQAMFHHLGSVAEEVKEVSGECTGSRRIVGRRTAT